MNINMRHFHFFTSMKSLISIVGLLIAVWLLLYMPNQMSATSPIPSLVIPSLLSPDGTHVAMPDPTNKFPGSAGGASSTVDMYALRTGAITHSLAAPNVTSMVFSPQGNYLATLARSDLRIWEVATGTLYQAAPPALAARTNRLLALAPDRVSLVLTTNNETIELDRVADGVMQAIFPSSEAIQSAEFSPDGTLIATLGRDVVLWRARDGVFLRRLVTRQIGEINPMALAFSPDSALLAVGIAGSHGRTVQLWRLDSQTEPINITAPSKDSIATLAFSHDGQLLAAAGGTPGSGSFLKLFPDWPRHNPITIWRVRDGARVQTLAGHLHGTSPLQFTPDDRQLVSGGGDHTIRVWRVLPIDPLLVWGWRLALALALGLLAWRWLRNYWRRHRAPAV